MARDKNKGELETSTIVGNDSSLLPAKYRKFVRRVITKQPVNLDEPVGTLSGDEIYRALIQDDNTRERQQIITTEELVAVEAMVGAGFFEESVYFRIEESAVDAGTAADSGLNIIDSQVEEVESGKSIKRTLIAQKWNGSEFVDGWPDLSGSKINDEVGKSVTFTEQMVTPPADPAADDNIEYQPINEFRSLKRVETVPTVSLESYLQIFPTRSNISVPDVLQSLEVVWNGQSGEGSFASNWDGFASGESYSISGSEGGNAESSASLQGELLVNIKQYWARNVPTRTAFFYLPFPITTATILAKLNTTFAGIARWPMFKPESHNLIVKGGSVSVSARAQGSASTSKSSNNSSSWDRSTGEGTSIRTQASNSVVRLPPTIHGIISVQGNLSFYLPVSATAGAYWVGYNFPSINVNSVKTGAVSGAVTPTSLPATSPASIPTSGYYLMDSSVRPINRWDYGLVQAEVLNAGNLA